MDWDDEAIETASGNLNDFGERVTLIHEGFSSLKTTLEEQNIREADGFLFDLGLSSMQLGSKERGFSFQEDAPLDMRMDKRKQTTAGDLVNNLPAGELVNILRLYGEERWARKIVSAILREREIGPIAGTRQLAEIIRSSVPPFYRRGPVHPATKTFQALRIAVNMELEHLETAIKEAAGHLKRGGRICVISFHSLEDRIVKTAFRDMERGCLCPPRIPYCVCNLKKSVTILTRKPIRPSSSEIISNPRARSAKLRVAEKV